MSLNKSSNPQKKIIFESVDSGDDSYEITSDPYTMPLILLETYQSFMSDRLQIQVSSSPNFVELSNSSDLNCIVENYFSKEASVANFLKVYLKGMTARKDKLKLLV